MNVTYDVYSVLYKQYHEQCTCFGLGLLLHLPGAVATPAWGCCCTCLGLTLHLSRTVAVPGLLLHVPGAITTAA